MAGIMDITSPLGEAAHKLLFPFVNLFDQRNLLSYLGAVLFLFAVIVSIRLRRPRTEMRLRALWRLITKRTVWLHRSARLDYRLYLLNMVLMAFVLGFFFAGSAAWSALFGRALVALFGPAAITTGHDWGIVALIALVQLLTLDGSYWLGHAAMHKSEVLWQFHKLHHSAEVMTPVTEFRQHPVELVWMPGIIAMATGLSYALLTHWFGTGAASMGMTAYATIACLHMATFHHLRHSHINMPFTGAMGIILHSPAHHIIHHSDDPAHFDRNMGYMLSIWDWMAGTLHMPRVGERVTLGVGAEGAEHDSVASALWVPIRDAASLIRRRFAGAPSQVMRSPEG
jgi:sterol desaturase/sphingolipid hydroxylase (fatty acid hydroxylase superfamily)